MENSKKSNLSPDIVNKEYWRDPEHFADLFNTYLYRGREVLKAEGLQEMDTESSAVMDFGGIEIGLKGTRDIKKVAKMQDGIGYMVLGVEDQNYIHYAMPLVVNEYEVVDYDRMYKGLKAHYKNTNELKGDERMSGIKSTDRLKPVITLVVYFGSKPWNGPLCMHDMLEIPDDLKPYVNNPQLNLVEVRDNNLVFHNRDNKDLFTLMGIILDNSLDRKTRREKLEQYESDRTVDKSVRMVIAASTNIDLSKFEEEEEIKVCTIWDEVREDGKEEGRAEGKIEGKVEGGAEEIVNMGIDFGLKKDDIIDRLKSRLNITQEVAEEYYNTFSGGVVTV